MGLFKWLIGYQAAKHLLQTARPRPVSVNLSVHLPDHDDDAEVDEYEDDYPLTSGRCIYVRDDGVNPPRFFNRRGEETDQNGYLL
ncbi:hypothetical protein [uncultured Dysosmobacter sp.]|uniref:hypothetical protein n=1 Tax=uncultured Dysosmobacter sp. TaxID=2591384 RepID=UPI002632A60E|nr:hypothetical protein [uncultured Dysosmobacter sp.]